MSYTALKLMYTIQNLQMNESEHTFTCEQSRKHNKTEKNDEKGLMIEGVPVVGADQIPSVWFSAVRVLLCWPGAQGRAGPDL